MRKNYFLNAALAFTVLSISLGAQNSHIGYTPSKPPAPKFKKHFALSSAFSYSVINNRKEVRGQYKPGINAGLNFYTKPWFYWSGEYTYFFRHSSSPGFENINSWNTELNGNLLMGAATTDLKFRFIFGVTYMQWDGIFVGPDVADDKTWYIGKLIEQDWVGATLGAGFSHPFGNYFNGYADFRMRFASQEKDLVSISDTAFNFGVQFNPYSIEKKKKSKNARPSRFYRWVKKRM
jgi:hypothetical protein